MRLPKVIRYRGWPYDMSPQQIETELRAYYKLYHLAERRRKNLADLLKFKAEK